VGEQFVVHVSIPRDHALVLLDWLARSSSAEHPVALEDQAEQRALWDLEASLEAILPEAVAADYREQVAAARARVRDVDV